MPDISKSEGVNRPQPADVVIATKSKTSTIASKLRGPVAKNIDDLADQVKFTEEGSKRTSMMAKLREDGEIRDDVIKKAVDKMGRNPMWPVQEAAKASRKELEEQKDKIDHLREIAERLLTPVDNQE